MQQQFDLFPAENITPVVKSAVKNKAIRTDYLMRLAEQIAPPEHARDTTPGHLALALAIMVQNIEIATSEAKTRSQRRRRDLALHCLRADPIMQMTLAVLKVDDVTRLCEV